ncbi:hypothetical protein Q5762_37590, partial [Streptomyces sp. P9(2023)]
VWVSGGAVMGWAQWLVAALLGFEVVAAWFVHGWPRPPVSFGSKACEVAALAFLLHLGGFWK